MRSWSTATRTLSQVPGFARGLASPSSSAASSAAAFCRSSVIARNAASTASLVVRMSHARKGDALVAHHRDDFERTAERFYIRSELLYTWVERAAFDAGQC